MRTGRHVELLAYRQPHGRAAARMRPADITASRLVFADDLDHVVLRDGTSAASIADPDGHAVLLLEAPRGGYLAGASAGAAAVS
jgi:hypothetical protein